MTAMLRLIFGLVAISLVAGVAQHREGNRIAAGIYSNAAGVANQLAADWAKIAVTGRDVTVSGTAPDDAARDAVANAVAEARGVRLVNLTAGLLPHQSPYLWSLSRQGGEIALSGSLPTQAARRNLIEIFEKLLPGAKWSDQTRLATGAPDNLPALQEFAAAALAQLASGVVTASDKTLRIEGKAASPEAFAALTALLAKAPAGAQIASPQIVPAAASPYVFSAASADKSLKLNGFAPSLAEHGALLAALTSKFAGFSIEDGLRIARPAAPEEQWVEHRSILLNALALLSEGSLTLSDGTVSVKGIAPTAFERDQVLAALAKPPAGLKTGEIAIALPEPPAVDNLLPPPVSPAEPDFGAPPAPAAIEPAKPVESLFPPLLSPAEPSFDDVEIAAPPSATKPVESLFPPLLPPAEPRFDDVATTPAAPQPLNAIWSARRDSAKLTLAGTKNEALRAIAGRLFSADPIDDRTSAGQTLPIPLVETLELGLDYLARLEEGTLAAESTGVSLTGKAPSQAVRDEIVTALANAPAGAMKIAAHIVAPPPPPPHPCQSQISEAEKTGVLNFDSGKTTLAAGSDVELQAIVEVLKHCETAKVEISGHTDNQGDAKSNQRLSEARALTVLNWLAKAGIAQERLSAVGFGDTRPLASNDTPEGKAKNRRIEFKLY